MDICIGREKTEGSKCFLLLVSHLYSTFGHSVGNGRIPMEVCWYSDEDDKQKSKQRSDFVSQEKLDVKKNSSLFCYKLCFI